MVLSVNYIARIRDFIILLEGLEMYVRYLFKCEKNVFKRLIVERPRIRAIYD